MNYLLQTPAQLAKHLPSLRNARHLTQAQLGMLVGLDQTRIAKIEADPRRVSVGQLFKILSALGVQVLVTVHRSRLKHLKRRQPLQIGNSWVP